MDAAAHQIIISQLDELAEQVAATIVQFERTGMTSLMKDDYVALHELEHRILSMRREHVMAVSDLAQETVQH